MLFLWGKKVLSKEMLDENREKRTLGSSHGRRIEDVLLPTNSLIISKEKHYGKCQVNIIILTMEHRNAKT